MGMTIFTEHALFQMHRRGISEKDVKEIIKNPEQIEEVWPGRVVMQSRILTGRPQKRPLVRVLICLKIPLELGSWGTLLTTVN